MQSNVQDRQVKWVFELGGVVSATLYVGGIAIYYSDWYGNPYKVDGDIGEAIWTRQISQYLGGNTPLVTQSAMVHANRFRMGVVSPGHRSPDATRCSVLLGNASEPDLGSPLTTSCALMGPDNGRFQLMPI